MARFVSPHRNFNLGIRNEVPAHLGPDGRMVPYVSELSAQFNPDLKTPEDVALAKSTFAFRGLAIYESGKEIDPAYRVSVFDSEVAALQNGWSADDTEEVIEALRHKGPVGVMYVEVVPAPAEKPWNGYDELSDAARIVELAIGIDADLAKVLQYEIENANRQDVVEAIQAAIESADETIIVSA